MPTSLFTPNDTDDVLQAEEQVALRKAALARSLHEAEASSERLVQRIGRQLKPTLAVVAAGAGVAGVVALGLVLARRGKRRQGWLVPEQPSALATFARGAGVWLLRVAVRRLAEEVVTRLGQAEPRAQLPPGRSVAASPDQI